MLTSIWLADFSHRSVEVGPDDTVGRVVALMVRKMGVVDEFHGGYFGLFPCYDGINHGPCLAEDLSAERVLKSCYRVVFKIACFGPLCLSSQDPGVLFLRYIQAKHDIAVGSLPCPAGSLSQLASLTLQQRFGTYKSDVHKSGSITDLLLELIPAEAFGVWTARPSKWDAQILKAYKRLGDRRVDPVREYLSIVEKFEFYGSSCFEVDYMSRPSIVAINFSGVVLFDDEELERIMFLKWHEIAGWGISDESKVFIDCSTKNGDPIEERCFELSGSSEPEVLMQCLTQMATILALGNNPALGGDGDASNGFRERDAERPALSKEQAAIVLQSHARSILVRRRYLEMQSEMAATFLQAIFRGYLARRDFGRHAAAQDPVKINDNLAALPPPPGMTLLKEENIQLPPGVPPPKAPPPPLSPPPGLLISAPPPSGQSANGESYRGPSTLPDSTEHIILPPPAFFKESTGPQAPPPPPPSVPPPDVPTKKAFKAPRPPPPMLDIRTENTDDDTDQESIPSPPDSPPGLEGDHGGASSVPLRLPTPPSTPPPPPSDSDDDEKLHV